MLLDKYEQREKKWRAARKRADELQPYDTRYHWRKRHGELDEYILWEPLERPVFAGWDMWVGLTEAGMRRRDAPKLMQVIQALGINTPRFIRESRYIRVVRRAGYNYKRVEAAWHTQNRARCIWYPLEPLFNRTITEKAYMALPGDIKPYFNRHVEHSKWGNTDVVEYHLDWHNRFPAYELVIKTKKSYNTFIGHLYGDQIGEYKKLRDWLWGKSCMHEYASIYGHVGYRRWYEKCYSKGGVRARWNAACRELKHCPNWIDEVGSGGEVNADDFTSDIERRYRLYSVQKYD